MTNSCQLSQVSHFMDKSHEIYPWHKLGRGNSKVTDSRGDRTYVGKSRYAHPQLPLLTWVKATLTPMGNTLSQSLGPGDIRTEERKRDALLSHPHIPQVFARKRKEEGMLAPLFLLIIMSF